MRSLLRRSVRRLGCDFGDLVDGFGSLGRLISFCRHGMRRRGRGGLLDSSNLQGAGEPNQFQGNLAIGSVKLNFTRIQSIWRQLKVYTSNGERQGHHLCANDGNQTLGSLDAGGRVGLARQMIPS